MRELVKSVVSQRSAQFLNVGQCPRILFKMRCQLFQALLMELIDILAILSRKNINIDQFATIRSDCKILKVVPFVPHFFFPMLLYHDHIFDSEAEFAVLVVSWLVTDTH